jgi:hypothetical protein
LSPERPIPIRRIAAFALTAGALIWYAVPHGSYDIVPRQENTIALWWVIGVGVAVGLLPRSKIRRESYWALLALALLVAWTGASLLWTSSDERTLAEVVRVAQYAGVVLLVLCLVSPTTWRPAAAGIAAGAAAVCALALASRLAPGRFPDTVADAFHLRRLSYPLGYWNAVAAWGAMTLAMVLTWSAHARTLVARSFSSAVVPLAVVTVYLTYSRAGVGDVVIALVAAFSLSANRWTLAVHALAAAGASAVVVLVVRDHPAIADGTGTGGALAVLTALGAAAFLCVLVTGLTYMVGTDRWKLPVQVARAAVVTASVLAIVCLLAFGRGIASNAWDDFRDTNIATTSAAEIRDPSRRLVSLKGTRYDVWSTAVDAFQGEPLGGLGAGTFEFYWNRDGGSQFIRDAHSLYIEQAAELGLPGVLLTIGALLTLALLGIRARFGTRDPSRAGATAALCAAFAVYLFHAGVDWMWEATAVSVLALAGIALAAAASPRPRAVVRPAFRIGLAVVAAFVCLIALPGLLSTTSVRASREAFRQGNLGDALDSADAAVSRQPAAATPYAQRGLVRWAQGNLPGAARDLRDAQRHERLNWRYPLLLSRLEAERGQTAASLRAFREARRLRPSSPFFAAAPAAPPAVP